MGLGQTLRCSDSWLLTSCVGQRLGTLASSGDIKGEALGELEARRANLGVVFRDQDYGGMPQHRTQTRWIAGISCNDSFGECDEKTF